MPSPSNTNSDLPTITIATTGRGVPMTYKNEQGTLQGVDVEILTEIGKAEGFNPVFVEAKWKDLFDGVETGTYDVAAAGISWTAERAGKYSLSDPYLFDPMSVAYKEGGKVKNGTLEELKGVKISLLKGTSYEKTLSEAGFDKLVLTESGFEALGKMMKDEADAYVHSQMRLRHVQANYKQVPLTVKPLEDATAPTTNLVMVVNKNKPELLQKINDGIKKLKEGGKIDAIVEQNLTVALPNK